MVQRRLAFVVGFVGIGAALGCGGPGVPEPMPALAPAHAPVAAAAPDPADLLRDLSPWIELELKRAEIPGFAITLVDGSGRPATRCFGHESESGDVPAGPASLWRVGSVSKMFTDLAVMQLVEQGRLALDEPVAKYLPEFHPRNPFGVPITLRELMAHRAGLVREPPLGSYFDATSPTLAATVASLNDTTLVHAPGTKMKYSNAGIAVVGRVVEVVTRQPFTQVVRERVLLPMGLQRSFFEATPEVRAHRVAAQMWTYWGAPFAAPTFELGIAPAGSLYAPIDDLATAMRFFLGADGKGETRVVTKASLDEMWKPQFVAEGSVGGYGLGFGIDTFEGRRCVGHDGAIYGFSTVLKLLPEERLGVAAVAALDVAHGTVGKIVDAALEALLAAKTGAPRKPPPTNGDVDAAFARACAGAYASEDGKSRAELFEQRGELWLQSGPWRARVRGSLEGGYVVDDRIESGRTVQIPKAGESLKIGSVAYARLPDARPAPVPAELAPLIGEYGFDHETLFVYEKAGRLHALIEWFFEYPLTRVESAAGDVKPGDRPSDDEGDVYAFPDSGLYSDESIVFRHQDPRDPSSRVVAAIAAGVEFPRRDVGTEEGVTFKIRPLKPVETLRKEALAAAPAPEIASLTGKRKPDLVELVQLDPSLHLDVRYATENNFMGAVFYEEPRAFLQRPAAEALKRAHEKLAKAGFGLLIHDGYRPWFVTRMFWDGTPAEHHDMVADPSKGSRHNRGCAVDLTLCDPKSGAPLRMPSGYDEFSDRANPWYFGGTSEQRWLRDTLRHAMEAEGFTVYENEWWHFDFGAWKEYPVLNQRFAELGSK